MKSTTFIMIAIVAAAALYSIMSSEPAFIIPDAAAGNRNGKGIKKYEFTELFDRNKPLSKLAKKDYYTVVEGYIDTCSICKKLEADFKPFLAQRKDVLIRKVHFPEGAVSQQFTGDSQEEVNRKMRKYYERLQQYNFNHVVITDTELQLSVCGTPHIEIYGPDRELIASDMCGDENLKTGLIYLRKWMRAESL